MEIITITPAMAAALLEHNTSNRPLRQQLVDRIARQIAEGKWRFNGDTIKISGGGEMLDGQHRLWAVILADRSIETILVKGIARDAFATIDTIRGIRIGADTLSLNGVVKYRRDTAAGLAWLLYWQRLGVRIAEYRHPKNKVENSDIEDAYVAHREFVSAVERVWPCRAVVKPSILAFLYYVLYSRDADLADAFLDTLENPAGVAVHDPFFKFRARMLESKENQRRQNPIETMALAFKAWNARKTGKKITSLVWRNQGRGAEGFPSIVG